MCSSDLNILDNGTVWLLTENDGAIRVLISKEDNHIINTKHYSLKTGLFPASRIYHSYLDSAGNEWILTDNGLGRIPVGSENISSYFVETKERFSDPKQSFYTIYEGSDEIWFGSDKGRIWKYLKTADRFELLELPTNARIISINFTIDNELIIATDIDGFYTYNLSSNDFKHYSPFIYRDLTDKPILSVYVDNYGEAWFEQEIPGVVVHFNPQTQLLKKEQLKVEPAAADRSRPSFHIHEDVNNRLWVHPYAGGFSLYDRQNDKLIPFYNELGSTDWKFSNKIHSSFSDIQGNLWISTHSKGLEKVTFRKVQFNMLTPEMHHYESLTNEVRALFEDKNNNIWVGLKDGRLRVYDTNHKYLGTLNTQGQVSLTGTPMKGTVYDIMQDSNGAIWFATKGDGLVCAEPIDADEIGRAHV